jgi:peptidyl-prolyl cis-trans isomerase-like protein 2
LDGKHTIFGKLVGGMAVLDKMESVPAGDNDCPTHEIIINEAVVFVDPFADYEKTEQRRISDVSSKKRKTGEC